MLSSSLALACGRVTARAQLADSRATHFLAAHLAQVWEGRRPLVARQERPGPHSIVRSGWTSRAVQPDARVALVDRAYIHAKTHERAGAGV